MIKLIDLLNEAKQVGILYHFTGFKPLTKILKDNCLYSFRMLEREGYNRYTSFTRNKNFNQVAKIFNLQTGINGWMRSEIGCICRITVDGDKLSNNYKFKPWRSKIFSRENPKSKWSQTPKVIKKGKKYFSADESEERIFTNEICIPIKEYTISVTLIDPDDKEIEIAKTISGVNFKVYDSETRQEREII
jgi:hypothetical protein